MRHRTGFKTAYLPFIVLLSLLFLGGGVYVTSAGLSDSQAKPMPVVKVVIENSKGVFESRPFEWQSEIILGKEDFTAKGGSYSAACSEICSKAGKCGKISRLAGAYILKKCSGESDCAGIAEKADVSSSKAESIAEYEIVLRNVCEA